MCLGISHRQTICLEKVAWTNSTTRATALARDGRGCKRSGDTTRLYWECFNSSNDHDRRLRKQSAADMGIMSQSGYSLRVKVMTLRITGLFDDNMAFGYGIIQPQTRIRNFDRYLNYRVTCRRPCCSIFGNPQAIQAGFGLASLAKYRSKSSLQTPIPGWDRLQSCMGKVKYTGVFICWDIITIVFQER